MTKECNICKEQLSNLINCNECSCECCKECLVSWLNTVNKCPLCRKENTYEGIVIEKKTPINTPYFGYSTYGTALFWGGLLISAEGGVVIPENLGPGENGNDNDNDNDNEMVNSVLDDVDWDNVD